MPEGPIQLEPTFPLDGERINKRLQRLRFQDPVCWVVAVGALVLGVLAHAGVLGFLFLLGLGTAGIWYRLTRTRRQFEARVIREMIAESNQSQDRQLEGIIAEFQRLGWHGYASALGRFLLLKQRIEANLHSGASLPVSCQDVDNLVDRVCALTQDQLRQLGALDEQVAKAITSQNEEHLRALEQARAHVLLQIQRAYCTLYQCLENVLGLGQTAQPARPSDALAGVAEAGQLPAIDSTIHELELHNELIQRTLRRVRTELSPPPLPHSGLGNEQDIAAAEARLRDLAQQEGRSSAARVPPRREQSDGTT